MNNVDDFKVDDMHSNRSHYSKGKYKSGIIVWIASQSKSGMLKLGRIRTNHRAIPSEIDYSGLFN